MRTFTSFFFITTQALNLSLTGEETSIEKLAEKVKESIVVIASSDRQGEESGMGTGFVIREDGVIATNFHVIGQHRAFSIRMADGTEFKPTSIIARDEKRDIAIVKVDAKGLKPLPLGDSDRLNPGQSMFAIGNPLGLEFSVSKGAMAATRDVDGIDMIQLAMPIEPGSSGSPVMDMQGKVHGIIAIKSGAAMGFAVPINRLKPLLSKPNPIKLEHWLTIGAIDPDEWTVHMGGDWRQRAGMLIASGRGSGFGGRTLCISSRKPPQDKFACEVEVKLHDESGAAGLAFYFDGEDNHYGFYPTTGALRLTRFAGPDVFNWSILETVQNDAYRPGEWNRIRVDFNKGNMICSVNGTSVIEFKDTRLKAGTFGLVKFRNPTAEFRNFRFGDDIPQSSPSRRLVSKVQKLLEDKDLSELPPLDSEFFQELLNTDPRTPDVLRLKAKSLQQQAAQIEKLANTVHEQLTIQAILKSLNPQKGNEAQLFNATLQLSRLDNPHLPIVPYERRIDRMTNRVLKQVPECANNRDKLDALITYLFMDQGFHGSDLDYYHRSNSYMNEVIDDREGLPITLCVLFLEIAHRMKLPVYGVAIPRHFIVAYHEKEQKEPILIDVFDSGKILTLEEAGELSGRRLSFDEIKPAQPKDIVIRMLHNLYNVAEIEEDSASMIRYLDGILAIDEESAYNRAMRAVLLASEERIDEAIRDLEWLVNNEPPGIQMPQIKAMLRRLYLRTQNP